MSELLKPVSIEPAMLVSSTATDSTPTWSAGTTYASGVQVQHARRVWRSTAAGNIGQEPGVAMTWWAELGPTNVWAMFDNQVSSRTSATGSLEAVISCRLCNAVGLAGLSGTSVRLRLRDGAAGPIVREWNFGLNGRVVAGWYQYFFEPRVQLTQLMVTDVPALYDGVLEVLVSGSGEVAVGVLAVGTLYRLGATRLGPRAEIVDYSRKETLADGTQLLEPGRWAGRVSLSTQLPNGQIPKVHSVVAAVRGQACFWRGTEIDGFDPFTVFGFCRSFAVEVPYQRESLCSLEIEGMTI